jgi:Ca2+-binding EF-hand superfamily protein
MIPNKTEEQILYQHFKFYDLDSSGFCSLQNFIKANDRLGVVLPKIENFEIIFNYFADQETSLLNYRKFIREIFNFKSKKEKNEQINIKKEEDFIHILTKKILEKGGTFPLIELVRNLQIEDFENNKWLNIDNFLKVLQKCKIFLNSAEIRSIFDEYDFFESGIVKYEKLIDIILEQFWNNEKLGLSEQIFYLLPGNGKRNANLIILKDYFEQILEDTPDKKYFIEFIDEYKIIDKNNVNQNMNLKDLVKFLKFYNFGRFSNEYLQDLKSILIDENRKETNSKKNCKNKILSQKQNTKDNQGKIINNYLEEGYENQTLNDVYSKLRENLIYFGRKTLFNFLKHFKFFDNKTKNISKYNFSKIFKNFNIKLSVDDIDIIFKNFSSKNICDSMNYELFLKDLVSGYVSKYRNDVINNIFDTLLKRSETYEREMDIPFLKSEYNAVNNYFIKEENENRNEFEECLETFHYSYNGIKYETIDKKEFCEFYYYISFLIPEEDDFVELISNEWKIPINNNELEIISKGKNCGKKFNNIIDKKTSENLNNSETIKDYRHKKNISQANKIQTQKNIQYDELYSKESQKEALSFLTNKLFKRGLRGILYLYSQFLSLCPNLNNITFNDFCLVLKIQHLDLDINSMKKIFNMYTIKRAEDSFLDFYSFMRTYKQELNANKLNVVEEAFSNIDSKGEDKVHLNVIKMKYNASKHPDVLNGKYTEDEKIMEFLDCFGLCYEILKSDSEIKNKENEDYVDFEIFANFYEYVSFIYPRDKDFEYVVRSTWS